MTKPKEVTISLKRIKNLGNYENMQYDICKTFVVEDDFSLEEEILQLRNDMKLYFKKQSAE